MQEPLAAVNTFADGGTIIVVVGPSGVGKDSLMAEARRHFSNTDKVRFVQRVITRAADGIGEDHRPASHDEFERMKAAGAFAIDWEAHGLCYGIPVDVMEDLAKGRIVIANGSRSALDQFADRFPKLLVINVSARPEILAARLAARGRESAEEIEARLRRTPDILPDGPGTITIDNSGDLSVAAASLIKVINDLIHVTA
ncbi:phosphonate metabolism protein/1,5-bisphosphokinase (PRPP-forming) PhnN [Rhizobium sp. AAP43]|uniref:phosphonate metabolism protein/1,5-bisphosphokinase (PRPP-forming) PhnN n=1 Tax=Rhizobium sp. AAP43 TaxID=1523420 RepID=UPI0006B9F6E6|nr:phosphonate metabolism protein/1,5-bisphosphokinase (PRPP-forming) PhnN [Rhizobium sp. AAP43]KPF45099.1 ribose-phosphate pyrophosphokinase [Rhizobium sp. AAP43]